MTISVDFEWIQSNSTNKLQINEENEMNNQSMDKQIIFEFFPTRNKQRLEIKKEKAISNVVLCFADVREVDKIFSIFHLVCIFFINQSIVPIFFVKP